ncbi:MAG: DUF192 domain-containing protein [Candidatus Nitrosotenuis sp.]
MADIRTLAIISVAVVAAAVIIYIINNQADDRTESQPKIQSSNEKYHQAKVDVNGFEIMADIAFTEEQREKGLSIKDTLNEDEGMLFIFQQESRYNFWMNGMKFPIDILWLDAAGKVVHIESNLQPCASANDCADYAPAKNALYVLEVAAGFAERHNVQIGTDIDFQLIR